jgi:hypothetical protein
MGCLPFFMSLTLVPAYIWRFGLDWFQVALFLAMFFAVGFSITLGYHRLYSHLTFQAHWSVRLFTLIFGAAAFENSVLLWACEHRAHHKHVDHEDDPYNIREGLFQAHIGWLLFKLKPPPPFDNVIDLQKDRLVTWQHQSKVGLANKLRRVPADRILRAELAASCDRNNADILGGRWPDERSYPRIGRTEYKRFAEKSRALCPEAKISILQAFPLRKRTDWGEKRLRVR